MLTSIHALSTIHCFAFGCIFLCSLLDSPHTLSIHRCIRTTTSLRFFLAIWMHDLDRCMYVCMYVCVFGRRPSTRSWSCGLHRRHARISTLAPGRERSRRFSRTSTPWIEAAAAYRTAAIMAGDPIVVGALVPLSSISSAPCCSDRGQRATTIRGITTPTAKSDHLFHLIFLACKIMRRAARSAAHYTTEFSLPNLST
jgi:hypothetical protein